MWPDNETEVDFLNFTSVSDTVAEIIVQTNRRPVSIGVSGAWGVGKSSMIKLIRSSLDKHNSAPSKYLFVEFNAWLYQGYDDVRAALLEIIATALKAEAEKRQTGIEKATELMGRVDWLRLVKLTAGTVAATALGLPPVGLLGEVFRLGTEVAFGNAEQKTLEGAAGTIDKAVTETKGFLRPKEHTSPPKEIHAIRGLFEKTLDDLGVTLVVLIDDLDRCLPETTIATLEAIRLFLFLRNTAFVIAADSEMIKHAVRKHFQGVDDTHVTSYFDKLIQVPIRVPPLGTQEVRAYLMLLFVESSTLTPDAKEKVRAAVCRQLAASWQGNRVDRAFMQTLGIDYPSEVIARFDAADRLAPVMTTASHIEGNPRLIKRFLNAFAIRISVAHTLGITVDEAVLTKLLLFERCGDPQAYKQLVKSVNEDARGRPTILAEWESSTNAGKSPELPKEWDAPFVREWLILRPLLADLDLRGALYVSREHAPLITPTDRLSSAGIELLEAMMEYPDMAASLTDRLKALPRPELSSIFDKLLENAQQIQEWGVPPILDACLTITRCDPSQGARLSAFIEKRPGQQLTAALIPKLSAEPWSGDLFAKLSNNLAVSAPVKKAIQRELKNGNV